MSAPATKHDDECVGWHDGARDHYDCTEACRERQRDARERDAAELEDINDARRKGER